MHKTQNNNIYGIIFNYTFDYKRKNTKEVWFDFICSLRCNLIACTWFMLKLLNYDQSRKLSIVYFLPTDFFQLKYIIFSLRIWANALHLQTRLLLTQKLVDFCNSNQFFNSIQFKNCRFAGHLWTWNEEISFEKMIPIAPTNIGSSS